MSLYTIATASLTTHDDHERRPAINGGQVARTLALCLAVAAAVVGITHRHAVALPAPLAALVDLAR